MDLNAFSGYKHVKKMWGTEIWLTNSPLYCAKLLVVEPGFACSLHRHAIKTETFFVLQGLLAVEVGTGGAFEVKGVGDSVHLPPGTFHRFWSVSLLSETIFLEVSTTHSDDDVERREESGPIG